LHVSLAAAVPNGGLVEYIPQLGPVTREPMRIEAGHAVAPDEPGLGIAWDHDAIRSRRSAGTVVS
jgi:L-alanine-DL-glutamate epimerase-like enolase superfamily enzyme